MVLAIETSTVICAAALVENGRVLSEHSLNEPHVHSEKLLSLIDNVLISRDTHRTPVDAIAISIGPGSFTGLRIGLSVAKGLCYAWNIPIVPVPTLHALAWNCIIYNIGYNADYVLPMLDAKRDELYAAMYLKREHDLEEVSPVRAISQGECLGLVQHNHRTIIIGDAVEKFQMFAQQQSPGRTDIIAPPPEQRYCTAASVGILGERMLREGNTAKLASLEPAYYKEFVTTLRVVDCTTTTLGE
ncbi:MAG: tRNA (adenosine(37)-N6)-threonylcarbamoyltransferase complex dimerization subunit type 1 TsaB [Bacteroidetes bacterium]|nr:MAG: tRNA (adenosine(37)-N6)-threonylcarbamoyltransferase complex dimerization subunit type 1 TsaB [Bacteroidota bacterium]